MKTRIIALAIVAGSLIIALGLLMVAQAVIYSAEHFADGRTFYSRTDMPTLGVGMFFLTCVILVWLFVELVMDIGLSLQNGTRQNSALHARSDDAARNDDTG